MGFMLLLSCYTRIATNYSYHNHGVWFRLVGRPFALWVEGQQRVEKWDAFDLECRKRQL